MNIVRAAVAASEYNLHNVFNISTMYSRRKNCTSTGENTRGEGGANEPRRWAAVQESKGTNKDKQGDHKTDQDLTARQGRQFSAHSDATSIHPCLFSPELLMFNGVFNAAFF